MKNKFQEIFGILILIGVVLVVLSSLFGNFVKNGREKEGYVTYDDCRAKITLSPNTWQKYFHTFIGTTDLTESGKVMGGEYVRIKNDETFFATNHTCAIAYIYEKEPEINCSEEYPYLAYDDKCYSSWDFGRVYASGKDK